MKLLALPRDPNPYQELLYGEMRRSGVEVRYACRSTPSHTLNLLGLPCELLVRRLGGFRVLHLHWTFGFSFPGRRFRFVQRVGREWLTVVLRVAAALGMQIVWTAHNALPHEPVFDDDLAARRQLVRRADLVICHSQSAVRRLEALGLFPRRVAVIPHGPIEAPGVRRLEPASGCRRPRTVLFFGRVHAYKGVEDLLEACKAVRDELRVVIVGGCPDPSLRDRLTRAAATQDGVTLRLERLPDESIAALIGSADALVYPFRDVTTSSSVMLGMASGRPVIVPDLPDLAGVPEEAAIRYPAGVEGLAEALRRTAAMEAPELRRRARAARAASEAVSWRQCASTTTAALERLLARPVSRSSSGMIDSAPVP